MTSQIKALFVSPGATAYGSGRSMLSLLRFRNFEAEVVCPVGGVLEQELHDLGVRVHPLEFGKYSVRRNPLWHIRFYKRFSAVLKLAKPDVVVINLDGNTPLVTLAAIRAGIPIIRFCRFEFSAPERWLDKWCWMKARAIICPSDLVKQQVASWAPRELQSRVHRFYEACVSRAVRPDEVASFRREFALGDHKIIGYVGRLHRGKRIETAVEALALVRKKVSCARLIIVGGYAGSPDETAYKHELEQLAAELGVTGAVIFTGYLDHDKIQIATSAFNVAILPSESESFGLVLVEAWAQGVPTVASDVSGCREITLQSGGGVLCPVGAASSFAKELVDLLSNPSGASSMGRAGCLWVQETCSPSDYATRFSRIACGVLDS